MSEEPAERGERSTRTRLRHLAQTWDTLGSRAPLWAVLTDPAKRGRKWRVAEFFSSGEAEIADCERVFADLGLVVRRQLAVDFGCGVGRLTRALSSKFNRVIGIDIAASMVAEARRLNADVGNVAFELNERSDLAILGDETVDFFYSRLVFQHMDPVLTLGYVAELGRILRMGGLAMFQIPNEPAPRSRLSRLARRFARPLRNLTPAGPRMSMRAVPANEVERSLAQAGLTLVAKLADQGALPMPSYLYVALRAA
jgi:SAM-dependent methyltransferase